MPKAHTTKPKEQTSLVDPRYDSKAASKSMNNYEKSLFRREQAAKAARVRAPRRDHGHDKGELCTLFATIH